MRSRAKTDKKDAVAGAAFQAEQLALDLPFRPALEAADFLVSHSNAAAVGLIDHWPGWSDPATLIYGPAACGKSHLVHVWQKQSGALCLDGSDIASDRIERLALERAVAIEDVDRNIGDETALFHLLNLARERNFQLLLTARRPPGTWDPALPDLRSRLRSLPVVAIEPPDDALMSAVLVKLFADRQLKVEPEVVAYIAVRAERSMAALRRLVDDIDRASLMTKRRITRQFAGRIIEQSGG